MKTQRARLYDAIYAKWAELDIDSFEAWLAGLGITWVELDNEITDAPAGTVAVWEGPGFENDERKQCWAVPDAAVSKLLDGAEQAAHSRLIETAPALLERLEAMVSGAECECDKGDPEHPLCDVCWSRQVIAKARGEAK